MPTPQAGDAVRLKRAWDWGILPAGTIGVIQGVVGHPQEEVSILFRASHFRGPAHGLYGMMEGTLGSEVVSSSGGPGTIATPVQELSPTGETVELTFWKWKDYPRAGGGVEYRMTVPVWDWSPCDRSASG